LKHDWGNDRTGWLFKQRKKRTWARWPGEVKKLRAGKEGRGKGGRSVLNLGLREGHERGEEGKRESVFGVNKKEGHNR